MLYFDVAVFLLALSLSLYIYLSISIAFLLHGTKIEARVFCTPHHKWLTIRSLNQHNKLRMLVVCSPLMIFFFFTFHFLISTLFSRLAATTATTFYLIVVIKFLFFGRFHNVFSYALSFLIKHTFANCSSANKQVPKISMA